VDVVDPELIVCLGATAARAVLGRPVTVGSERGRLQQARGRQALVTVHPSSILRVRGDEDRSTAFDGLVQDLRAVAEALR
jgi:DNA polymerase